MGFSRYVGLVFAAAAAVMMLSDVVPGGVALTQERDLTDGVYSDGQATRGRRIYRQACSSCHANDLEGGEMGPGLRGAPFIDPWSGESLAELLSYVQETMPQDNPGGLREQDYTDVVAYMLQMNEFPPGDGELSSETIGEIVIESSE